VELHAGERVARAAQADFPFRGPVGVVEHGPRHPAGGDRPQVGDRVRAAEPSLGGAERDLLRAQQRLKL
jgi:hypothetical protein